MQQSANDDAVTPPFLMELFNKFFTKSFEKDPKYSTFQKEWDSFKDLLNKENIDLDQVFAHIAKVQFNLEQGNRSGGSEVLQEKPFIPNLGSTNGIIGSDPPGFSSHTPTNYLSYPSVSNPDKAFASKPDNFYGSPSVTAKNFEVTSQSTTPLLSKQTFSSTNSAPVGQKFQNTFITEKAKNFKQNVQKHNEGLADMSINFLKGLPPNPSEERTALRHIVIYAKQPNFKEISKDVENKITLVKSSGQTRTLVYP